jgi:serine phosphatase RsbU (regulator of sigma subunit)
MDVLRRHSGESCATLLQRSVEAINRFADTRAQFDDITLVLARRN